MSSQYRNVNWRIKDNVDGSVPLDGAQLAVLMDIRRELQTLNGLLNCPNFLDIPRKLDKIARAREKPKQRQAVRRTAKGKRRKAPTRKRA